MNGWCVVIPALCVARAAGHAAGSAVGGVVSSAWQQVCQSFADAAASMLKAFAKAFAAMPDVSLNSAGIRSVYVISLGIATSVAALLLIGQVIRTALTHDGSALATGLVGVGKAALAFLLTLAIGGTGLAAADEVTRWIVTQSFGSIEALSHRLGNLLGGAAAGNQSLGTGVSAALLLVFGIIGILLVIVLWFELLLRNAAIAVLIATSPIAAAGQVSETTKAWWTKLVSATVQLIILKPVIALVFAVGLSMTGQATDVETLLAGMLVLVLAVFAWPAIARFFTFASVQVAGGSGLAALLGFAAGRATGGGGVPAGIEPSEFSRRMEQRTMARMGGADGLTGDGASSIAGATAPASTATAGTAAGGAAAAAGTAGVAGVAVAGARMAQQAINSLTGRMEQTAGHAGMQGANPYAQPAGTPRYRYGGGYGQPLPSAGSPAPAEAAPTGPEPAPPSEPGGPPVNTGTAFPPPQAPPRPPPQVPLPADPANADPGDPLDASQPRPPAPPPPPDKTRTDPPGVDGEGWS
jgi:hypothetical protein